jgi:hypothetical protein
MDAVLEALHQRMIAAAQQLERELASVGVEVKFIVRPEDDGVSIHVPFAQPGSKEPARKKASK